MAMPPRDNSAGAKPLTPAEVELVKKWIDAGAAAGDDGVPMAIAWQPVPGNFQPIYAVDTSIDGQFVASGRGNQVVVHSWPLQSASLGAIALVDPQTVATAGVPSAHLDLVQSVALALTRLGWRRVVIAVSNFGNATSSLQGWLDLEQHGRCGWF